MGIAIQALWPTQTVEEEQELEAAWLTRTDGGSVGVLAAYSEGEEMALMHLCPELFQSRPIPAVLMQARLGGVLDELEQAIRATDSPYVNEWVNKAQQNHRDFVAFCARKEQETGQPIVFMKSG